MFSTGLAPSTSRSATLPSATTPRSLLRWHRAASPVAETSACIGVKPGLDHHLHLQVLEEPLEACRRAGVGAHGDPHALIDQGLEILLRHLEARLVLLASLYAGLARVLCLACRDPTAARRCRRRRSW